MYMRLIGYPADKIAILTTYNGQKHLIRDVIRQRCATNPLIGQPSKVNIDGIVYGQVIHFMANTWETTMAKQEDERLSFYAPEVYRSFALFKPRDPCAHENDSGHFVSFLTISSQVWSVNPTASPKSSQESQIT